MLWELRMAKSGGDKGEEEEEEEGEGGQIEDTKEIKESNPLKSFQITIKTCFTI